MTYELYQVKAGYHHRCGGEDFIFAVEAWNEEGAKAKAKAEIEKIEQMLAGADKFTYEAKQLEIPANGVLLIHHDYYER